MSHYRVIVQVPLLVAVSALSVGVTKPETADVSQAMECPVMVAASADDAGYMDCLKTCGEIYNRCRQRGGGPIGCDRQHSRCTETCAERYRD